MKKIFFLSLLIFSLAVVSFVSADQTDISQEMPEVDIGQALLDIVNWLFGILLITAAIFITIAGFYFVTAQGEPDKFKTARQFVLYALIGVLVAFSAKGLVFFIGKILGSNDISF